MRSKTYQAIKTKAPDATVDIATAVTFIKEYARKSFDETIELHVRLGVNPSKSDQMVRGQVTLPSGTTKQQSIIVFTADEAQQKAVVEAGATKAGGEELINEINEAGSLDADITIATLDMMPKVAKAAKVLGPKGLMPNPKTGTVSEDPAATVTELLGGKVSFKMDQLGNIHQAIAKASWDIEKTTANAEAFLNAVRESKPSSAKGEFVKTIVLKSTMGPAIKISA